MTDTQTGGRWTFTLAEANGKNLTPKEQAKLDRDEMVESVLRAVLQIGAEVERETRRLKDCWQQACDEERRQRQEKIDLRREYDKKLAEREKSNADSLQLVREMAQKLDAERAKARKRRKGAK